MKMFLREVIAAIKEGPKLFFAPVMAALQAANQDELQRQPVRRNTPSTPR